MTLDEITVCPINVCNIKTLPIKQLTHQAISDSYKPQLQHCPPKMARATFSHNLGQRKPGYLEKLIKKNFGGFSSF